MRTAHVRQIEARSREKRLARFKALGLTTRGLPYRRTPHLPPEQRAANNRLICRRYKQIKAKLFRALGLTTRGTEYKRTPKPKAGLPQYSIHVPADLRMIVELEIDGFLNELNLLYQWLPAKAQVSAVRLAHSIGSLKRRIKSTEDENLLCWRCMKLR